MVTSSYALGIRCGLGRDPARLCAMDLHGEGSGEEALAAVLGPGGVSSNAFFDGANIHRSSTFEKGKPRLPLENEMIKQTIEKTMLDEVTCRF